MFAYLAIASFVTFRARVSLLTHGMILCACKWSVNGPPFLLICCMQGALCLSWLQADEWEAPLPQQHMASSKLHKVVITRIEKK
jgi:hypothetical protein